MLYLSDNSISDGSFLSDLTGLTMLDLSYNKIQEIPKYLAEGRLSITTNQYSYSGYINLSENPVETPPLEIVNAGLFYVRSGKILSRRFARARMASGIV